MSWLKALEVIINAVPNFILERQRQAAAKQERADQLEAAKVNRELDRLAKGQEIEAEWDTKALDQSGWKDEYITVILSIPLIGCFIPGLQDDMLAGFKALEQTPEWYQVSVAVMIAAVYGFRKFADWRMGKFDGKGKETKATAGNAS